MLGSWDQLYRADIGKASYLQRRLVGGCRHHAGMSGNPSAAWAAGAVNKFRSVARSTENPTTKQLAEGLAFLAEAIRALDPSEDVDPPTLK
jgi:hypothetical protein